MHSAGCLISSCCDNAALKEYDDEDDEDDDDDDDDDDPPLLNLDCSALGSFLPRSPLLLLSLEVAGESPLFARSSLFLLALLDFDDG